MRNIFMILLLVGLSPLVIMAQVEKKESDDKKNQISLFLGATSNIDATAFTIGLDYQYRINRLFGVGALVDHAMGDIQSTLLAPALYLHVWHLEFTVAPAAEFSKDETTAVLRVGVEYGFEISRFSVSPALFFDTERNEEPSLVYGVSFGIEL